MKRTTWADARVAAAVEQGFIPVKIDVDEQPAVAREFGVSGIPRVEAVRPAVAGRGPVQGFSARRLSRL